jgi:hypothetical protein
MQLSGNQAMKKNYQKSRTGKDRIDGISRINGIGRIGKIDGVDRVS